jgi:2-polyprenyl-3-methyl-5-hydroxy-6-metoxy-1,4-benzoquinol methylase
MLSDLIKKYPPVDVSKMRADAFLKVQDDIEQAKLRGIEAGSGWKDVPACPLCGHERRTPEFPKHGIDLACCQRCQVRYGVKIPANLADVYRNAGYVSYSKADDEAHYNYRRERFGRERVGILEKYCGALGDKRILDVGCGNGYFLSVAMEKSRHCFGTEFSDRLRAFAQEKTGLTIYNKTLADLPERGFDVITLFDVIEHIPEPMPFMREVDRILDHGGSVLIFTPNFDSLSIKVLKAYSSIVDPTEHVVLFNRPSLEWLAQHLGYEVIYFETHGLDIQNILAGQRYKGEPLDEFLMQWHHELQSTINESRCADYGRIMIRKPAR